MYQHVRQRDAGIVSKNVQRGTETEQREQNRREQPETRGAPSPRDGVGGERKRDIPNERLRVGVQRRAIVRLGGRVDADHLERRVGVQRAARVRHKIRRQVVGTVERIFERKDADVVAALGVEILLEHRNHWRGKRGGDQRGDCPTRHRRARGAPILGKDVCRIDEREQREERRDLKIDVRVQAKEDAGKDGVAPRSFARRAQQKEDEERNELRVEQIEERQAIAEAQRRERKDQASGKSSKCRAARGESAVLHNKLHDQKRLERRQRMRIEFVICHLPCGI